MIGCIRHNEHVCIYPLLQTGVDMAEDESGGEVARTPVGISPETLASIDKITAITLSCTKQLQAINDAMERFVFCSGRQSGC